MKFICEPARGQEGQVPQAFVTLRGKLSLARAILAPLAVLLITCSFASAGTLKGSVTNGTTGKPVAGCDVLLMKVSDHGMGKEARSMTDAEGHFSFRIADDKTPRLVRVTHQGVTYHKMAAPAADAVGVKVYDVVQELKQLTGVVHVQRFQAEVDNLQVTEVVTVRNASNPPRTLKSERGFLIQLPPEAEIDSAMAHAAGTQPLRQTLIRGDRPGQYYSGYPLRPGETRFAVAYRLPYTGEAVMEPKIVYPLERFAVVLSSSLKFEPIGAGVFKPKSSKTGDTVQVTAAIKPGQHLSFRISGGPAPAGNRRVLQPAYGSETPPSAGPVAAAAESPDPRPNQHWWILGALAVLLTAGVIYTRHRIAAKTAHVSQTHNTTTGSSPGLEALKDHLLQLEIGRHEGRISPEQYGREKAAFQRALLLATARPAGESRQAKICHG